MTVTLILVVIRVVGGTQASHAARRVQCARNVTNLRGSTTLHLHVVGVESRRRASIRLDLPASLGGSMSSVLAGGFTVEEVAEAYHAMEALVRTSGFAQDEQGLLEAVIKHLEGADAASITELSRGRFLTLAASDQSARDGDDLQFALGSGPCLDAIMERTAFAPIDLTTDPRWPAFGLKVTTTLGFYSMMSVRLLTDVPDSVYGLNVYSRRPQAFDQHAVLFGLLVGTYASSVVHSSDDRSTILNLEKALASNRQIGMAVGVIMATYRLTPERSFELLRVASMNTNRKLRDVAESVVRTGSLDLSDDGSP
jgi:hypothetical protein